MEEAAVQAQTQRTQTQQDQKEKDQDPAETQTETETEEQATADTETETDMENCATKSVLDVLQPPNTEVAAVQGSLQALNASLQKRMEVDLRRSEDLRQSLATVSETTRERNKDKVPVNEKDKTRAETANPKVEMTDFERQLINAAMQQAALRAGSSVPEIADRDMQELVRTTRTLAAHNLTRSIKSAQKELQARGQQPPRNHHSGGGQDIHQLLGLVKAMDEDQRRQISEGLLKQYGRVHSDAWDAAVEQVGPPRHQKPSQKQPPPVEEKEKKEEPKRNNTKALRKKKKRQRQKQKEKEKQKQEQNGAEERKDVMQPKARAKTEKEAGERTATAAAAENNNNEYSGPPRSAAAAASSSSSSSSFSSPSSSRIDSCIAGLPEFSGVSL